MITLLSLAVVSTGCTLSSNGASDLQSSDQLITNSVVNKTIPEGVSETDAEIIKTAVVDAKSIPKAKPLAWSNPETGTSGSIVAIDNFMGKHGQNCRGFKTTVDNFMGIAFYNGEACQISAQQWVLSWFKSVE